MSGDSSLTSNCLTRIKTKDERADDLLAVNERLRRRISELETELKEVKTRELRLNSDLEALNKKLDGTLRRISPQETFMRDLSNHRPQSQADNNSSGMGNLYERHITWDEYFMSVAQLAAMRSKDPSTQVGACIVNSQNKIVATGYNGMPNGVHDNQVPWNKEGAYLDTKYAYVVHAELNAILNSTMTDLRGCRVYVSLFPCNECAKAIIQSGIKHVIYLSDKHADKDSTKAAKIMFDMAGVSADQYSSGPGLVKPVSIFA